MASNSKQKTMFGEMLLIPSPQANVGKDVQNADGIMLPITINARMKQSTNTKINATQGSTVRTCAWQVKTNSATGHSPLTEIRTLLSEPAEPYLKTT